MAIVINTRLHDGIYESCGGETRAHYRWRRTGPINLLQAVETLKEHREEMEESFGSIGAGRSWIEVDGIPIDEPGETDLQPGCRLETARDILAAVREELNS